MDLMDEDLMDAAAMTTDDGEAIVEEEVVEEERLEVEWPSQVYASLEEGKAAVKAAARESRFGVTVRSSTAKRAYLMCDRARKYVSEAQAGNRTARSRMLPDGCPFSVAIAQQGDDTWQTVVLCGRHSHGPSPAASAHPSHRRLAPDLRAVVRQRANLPGVSARAVRAELLLQDANVLVTRRDIANILAVERTQQLDGRSSVQALMERLAEADPSFVVRHQVDEQGQLTHLFLASRQNLELAVPFGRVLIMDCTYKTNVFQMPLLQVVGVTNTKIRTPFEHQHHFYCRMRFSEGRVRSRLYLGIA